MSFNLTPLTDTLSTLMMTTHPSLISDLGSWNETSLLCYPWWTKTKLWATPQITAGYSKANLDQAILTQMQGNTEGYVLQILE